MYVGTCESNRNEVKLALVVNGYVVKLPSTECYLCDYSKVRKILTNSLSSFSCHSVCKDGNKNTFSSDEL